MADQVCLATIRKTGSDRPRQMGEDPEDFARFCNTPGTVHARSGIRGAAPRAGFHTSPCPGGTAKTLRPIGMDPDPGQAKPFYREEIMSVMDRLAHNLGRKDDVPNQELARDLAEAKDSDGVAEIAAGLRHQDKRIQSNCIKVLYEIGYLDPTLIAPYHSQFVDQLRSSSNRLVWGSMIALSTIAALKADELYARSNTIRKAVDEGSVITQDAGILALSVIASANAAYRKELFPYLLEHLANCRPKDVAQRAEKIAVAVDEHNHQAFSMLVRERMAALKPAQVKRLEKVLRSVAQQ